MDKSFDVRFLAPLSIYQVFEPTKYTGLAVSKLESLTLLFPFGITQIVISKLDQIPHICTT
jgi:hypothetical protein